MSKMTLKNERAGLRPSSIKVARLGLRLRMLVSWPRRRRRRRHKARRRRRRWSNVVLDRRCRSRATCNVVAGTSSRLHAAFTFEDQFSPRFGLAATGRRALSDGISENLHPAVLISCTVGIEVDDLSVREANTESLLHEHVALFLFGKSRLAPPTIASCGLSLGQRGSIVNQFSCLRQVDSRARLTSCLMVGSQLRSHKFEEAAAPVLFEDLC